MNKNLFRSVLAFNNDTYITLAVALGITAQSVSNKVNERGTEFTLGEIKIIRDRYNLSADAIESIFFA